MTSTDILNKLLGEEEIDDQLLCPVGTWLGELVSVSKKNKPKDSDADYKFRITFTFEPKEPRDGVLDAEANEFMESDDFDGTRLWKTYFMSNKSDVRRVKRILEMLGFDGSIEEAIESLNGGYYGNLEVEHGENFRGEMEAQITGIRAAD